MLTLINGEKFIVREQRSEVLGRVLAYRAKLLAAVARRLSPSDALRRAASLASVEFAEDLPPGDPPKEQRNEDERQ